MSQLPPIKSATPSASPEKSLVVLRIIWGALLMGQLCFLVVLIMLFTQRVMPFGHLPQPTLTWISVALLVVMVPVGALLRWNTFRRARTPEGTLPPAAYASGSILFWACCEGVTFFALIVVMVNASFWPTILVAAASMAIQLVAFPTGAPLKTHPATFQID